MFSTANEFASHDNNMEAFMDDYIFHNTLAKTPSFLTYEFAICLQFAICKRKCGTNSSFIQLIYIFILFY